MRRSLCVGLIFDAQFEFTPAWWPEHTPKRQRRGLIPAWGEAPRTNGAVLYQRGAKPHDKAPSTTTFLNPRAESPPYYIPFRVFRVLSRLKPPGAVAEPAEPGNLTA